MSTHEQTWLKNLCTEAPKIIVIFYIILCQKCISHPQTIWKLNRAGVITLDVSDSEWFFRQ